MSGLIPNSLTLYLRPIENIPPRVIYMCAEWMVKNNILKNPKIDTVDKALKWLTYAEDKESYNYKAVLSRFFDANDFQTKPYDTRNVNKYQSSSNNLYGEDPHMWWYSSVGNTMTKFKTYF